MNAEIPVFDTVEYRALLHVTKVLFVFKKGVKLNHQITHAIFPLPSCFKKSELDYPLVCAVFVTIIAP